MKVKRSVIIAALLFLGMVSVAQSQETYIIRKFGLTGSFQGVLLTPPGGGAPVQGGLPAILVPLWLSDTMTLAPGIQFTYVENVGSTIGIFLVPRFYLDMKRIAPYLTAQAGIVLNRPKGGGGTEDVLLAGGFGGEYFVNPKFSFGIEALLVGSSADFSGAAQIVISTAMAVHANIYF